MQVVHRVCAGLDVHKDVIVACIRRQRNRRGDREVRSFDTTTTGLLGLADWLTAAEVTHAAMEATGVYWKPVWHILEGSCELLLANPLQVRAIPGRKSDVNDAQWLADLLAHGLVRPSFVPPEPVMELRDLTRTRKQLSREVAQHTLRIQKVLEDANIKFAGVVSDTVGTSGRAVLHAIVEGESDPERLVDRTSGRLHASRESLVESLRGRVTDHHRFMLRLHLDQIDAIQSGLSLIEARIETAVKVFNGAAERLATMPGISTAVASALIAEIGCDMRRFPTPGHLVSWAGLCPRMDESAGKRRTARVRPGAPWLKTVLVQSAWSASRSKGTYLQAQFFRLRARRGPKKAVVAVAASMLTAAYFILRDGVEYHDLGGDYFDRRDKAKVARRLVKRIQDLGFKVSIAGLPAVGVSL